MFARFFIDRPIFAAVLSIIITLSGGIALVTLPVTQYPEITPPTVEVSAIYPGANATVIADTVAAPIEQQVNGVEDMLYMSSRSTNDGSYTLTVTFRPGTDLNLAQVLVQNRVGLAQPVLPELVRRRGVTVKKKSPSVLMMINLYSPDSSRDNLYLSNYATIQLRDELSRLPGVGDIAFLGQRDYSMRVWLDPIRMSTRRLSPNDVVRAIEQQNIQVPAGQIGQPPAPPEQVFQYTMTTMGRLSEEQQFSDMILKTDDEGRITRLKDVARVELGALDYDQVCTLDQKPTVALSIYQLPGSNALDTASSVRAKMEELKQRFPAGVDYAIVYDTTPFVRESINEVFYALRDAVLLVSVVVLIFLRGWRAAVIPLVAVPVAIIGTFAAMAACGFSLNTLTLFGLVLAIGIVVDDAIVVVEAIEQWIERGLAPREAAVKAMDEVDGPVIAVGLVLTAVFVPCIFISGIVGQFFRQFALTIAISTIISAFNSLTLSPALAVLLLRPRHAPPQQPGEGKASATSAHSNKTLAQSAEPLPRLLFLIVGAWLGARWISIWVDPWLQPQVAKLPGEPHWWSMAVCGVVAAVALRLAAPPINQLLAWALDVFNRLFGAVTSGYVALVGGFLKVTPLILLAYGALLFWTYQLVERTPTGFSPTQDKGYLLVNVQLPESASLDRTASVLQRAEQLASAMGGVRHTLAIAGNSVLLNAKASNVGTLYVMLDDFEQRGAERTGKLLSEQLTRDLTAELANAEVYVFGAPPIDGLGTSEGFRIVIQDRGGLGDDSLKRVSDRIVNAGDRESELANLFSTQSGDTTWVKLEIDRDVAKLRHVSLAELFGTLQVNLGSLYVNDFNRFGRTWQVNVQADGSYRMNPGDLRWMSVRSEHGKMVPLDSMAHAEEARGPRMVVRYNLYPSAIISANPAAGSSSGQAIDRLAEVSQSQLLPSMRAEWTELALLQQNATSTSQFAFLLAVVLVFLVLAAQYESWALPLAVILVVPMCLLCSVIGVRWAGLDINIFTQVGFVVLVGLACKNAILIVEFARARHADGASRQEAIREACRLRLRPIIMTSLAFIFGVVPLIVGTGAGAEVRHTLGVAVFAGMLGVTVFGILLTPVFYSSVQWVVDWLQRKKPATSDAEKSTETAPQ
ncbi:MAG: efflux RND transporter permease subunit [Planctomycetota bacterium]